METLSQDLRYGLRTLIKSPGFSFIAVFALALGIGANTAIFSVVNSVLLRPLPYDDPDRIVMVWEKNIPRNRERNVVSPANFLDWNNQNSVFEQMAAVVDTRINLTGAGEPEELQAQVTTASLFPLLGIEARHGRTFMDQEDQPGSLNFVVLSHKLWQRRFGGDPQIVGQGINLNGESYAVAGVMSPDFYILNKDAELWIPMGLNPARDYRRTSGRYMRAVARLKPGVSVEQAQAEMTVIASRLEESYQQFNAGWSVNIVPIHEQVVGDVRTALVVLLGAVAFVLLIACANVANLLLARATARQKELAVRTALGASRFRIVRQLLTESVLLAGFGGAAGLLLAYWGVKLLIAISPKNIPRLDEIGVAPRVLAFTLGISFLTGIVFGLLPALHASRPDLNETLKEGGRGSTAGGPSRVRNLFVVAEVALSLVLLIGAGLMVRSFLRLQDVNPGFSTDNLLTMRVLLPGSKYRENKQRIAFFEQAHQRLETLPGVKEVGAISFLPLSGQRSSTSFKIEGRPEPEPGQSPVTDVRVIRRGYFGAMGIPLLKGRLFTERDTAESPRVLIINEAMARRHFPDEDPLGKRLAISWSDSQPNEIVGVVADIKDLSLEGEITPTIYWPYAREPYSFMNFVIRTDSPPMSLASALQSEIKAIDADQPVADMRLMSDVLADSISRPRFNMLLLSIFASVALLLAAVGIYGVMSYSVTQRTHEIGIRLALGARPRDVLKMVIVDGMALAGIGIVIGAAAALLVSRAISSLLFGISASDPVTFAGLSLLLFGVALLACYIPARRATRVDPIAALRYE